MASIIKLPEGPSKGVLVFTDGEWRDWLNMSLPLRRSILELKSRWILVVHANSAVQQRYDDTDIGSDDLIDAFMAGSGDIVWTGRKKPYQIEMDCSNFCPPCFDAEGEADKPFWDLLYVSRNQKFKNIDSLFHIVRRIFDEKRIRVLAIIAEASKERSIASEPLDLYMSKFTGDERRSFTLLSPWIDYPFTFDLPTLAQFYRHSRAFLHTAAGERHPRVVGYAWAAGIPVIAPIDSASLIPPYLAQPPGFFPYATVDGAAERVLDVLSRVPKLPRDYSEFHLARYQQGRFKHEFESLYNHLGQTFTEGGWLLENLDVRLARHHGMTGAGTNSLNASLFQLIQALKGELPSNLGHDPEMEIDTLALRIADNPYAAESRNRMLRMRELLAVRDAYRNGGILRGIKHSLTTIARMAGVRR